MSPRDSAAPGLRGSRGRALGRSPAPGRPRVLSPINRSCFVPRVPPAPTLDSLIPAPSPRWDRVHGVPKTSASGCQRRTPTVPAPRTVMQSARPGHAMKPTRHLGMPVFHRRSQTCASLRPDNGLFVHSGRRPLVGTCREAVSEHARVEVNDACTRGQTMGIPGSAGGPERPIWRNRAPPQDRGERPRLHLLHR
jgi:hypothetical protein